MDGDVDGTRMNEGKKGMKGGWSVWRPCVNVGKPDYGATPRVVVMAVSVRNTGTGDCWLAVFMFDEGLCFYISPFSVVLLGMITMDLHNQ